MPGTTSNNRNAYATLLTSDSYLPGARVLASSLRATITRCPLICLVKMHFRALDVTYTKLHVFNPQVTGCDKVAFMDADVMITRNVDALFDYLQEDVVFAAAPDIGWPDCFNSGVFVCKPRLDVFQGLVRMAATTGSFDGGDQGLLNDYFSGWASGVARPGSPPHRTARLPFTYNVTPTSFYSYLPALVHFANDISAVHFIGTNKPWTSSREPSDSVVGLSWFYGNIEVRN
ncbi:nucleotide-diphospho-sugar transferase [Powellomyces hirtus]|nr:nucleotide-diphospho-sugar transferase [Powellomyces hirtus]